MDDNKSLSYFFLGLGVGVAVGMIFAPQAGAQTRTVIRSRASESGDYLRRRGANLREGASSLLDKGKEVVTRQREHLNAAVEAGRSAYREVVGGAEGEGEGAGAGTGTTSGPTSTPTPSEGI
jgi:gas vesicle protein